jgi:phenylalanyl-tRNA synthetase beta chain
MLISVNWLKKYVDVPVATKTLVKDLTMIGNNVEHCTAHGAMPPGLIIGRVLSAAKHPNADRLTLCVVQLGEDKKSEIVCGAPNVAAGQCVPVAVPGTTLPNGMKIKKSKIRGVVSNGMICSEIELGIGEDAAGIIVLDGEFEPGTPFEQAMPPADEVLEIEVTPNRPDLLSHIGIAREVSALYQTPLKLPFKEIPAHGEPDFEIEISDGEDCPRYVGRMIREVKVGPSPAWLVNALEAVELRSVNNIVDITNYVLMETGHPLHAFDFPKLKGGKIIVRRGEKGERIAALNGMEYDLNDNHLVIADEHDPVAVAGVIGGMPTSVTDETTDILLESACFEATLVRRTRKQLNLSTDASYRFERGADREACRAASDRVCELIQELAGGTPGEIVDAYPQRYVQQRIEITRSKTNRLLGIDVSLDEIIAFLDRLEFNSERLSGERAAVQAPTFRLDILQEADLIEEVGRMYGYNRIGTGWSFKTTAFAERDPFDRFLEEVSDHLCARGLTEVITSSFTDGREDAIWGWADDDPKRQRVRVSNPLNVNQGFMRATILHGMIEAVRRNMDQGLLHINIFEIGKIFSQPAGTAGLPQERLMLGIVKTAPDDTDFWNNLNKHTDLFDIKKEIEALADAFRVDIHGSLRYDFDQIRGEFVYQDDDETVIEGGIVPGSVSDKFDFDQPVWYATIDLEHFYRHRSSAKRYNQLPEYPVSKRDLSLVAGASVDYRQIEKALVRQGSGLLESLQVFDVYRGGNLLEGSTAYGVRLVFRSPDRTLTDKEIDGIIEKMISKLNRDLKVVLRS